MLFNFLCVCAMSTWKRFINKICERVLHRVLKYVLRLYKYFNYKLHAFGSMWLYDARIGYGSGGGEERTPPPHSDPDTGPSELKHASSSIFTYF